MFLSSFLCCLNVFSASKPVDQKTVRMGDLVYIDQHGSLIQVDMKRVTVKPKTGVLDKNIETITGYYPVVSRFIYAGSNVTSSKPQGEVVVQGGDVEIYGNDGVILKNNVTVEEGATMKIVVGN